MRRWGCAAAESFLFGGFGDNGSSTDVGVGLGQVGSVGESVGCVVGGGEGEGAKDVEL